ncbi:MAG TPA: MarR family transcriptional regulator [Acidimicrobiales bacterium]|nr:MarR family transcriptional regulator [Acidimicrobiales bacterium]
MPAATPTTVTRPATKPRPDDAAVRLASSLRLVVSRLSRRIRRQSLGGLSTAQLSVLATLEHDGGMRMGELARRERISPPSVTSLVGRLADADLVERVVDPDDARSTTVRILPAGAALLDRVRHERTALLRSGIDAMSPDEQAVIEAALPLLERLAEESE